MRATHPMHVHLYKVSRSENLPPLERLIEAISTDPLDKRLQDRGNFPIRMEDPLPPEGIYEGLWRLTFLKFRHEGPGRVSVSKAAESIKLDKGEYFSEDTAALFDPARKALVLQYNHYGPRAQAIEDYFTAYADQNQESYSLELQINREAQARLENKKLFSKLKFKIAPDRISKEWKDANIGLATAFERTAAIADGDWISVEISLERREHHRSLGLADKLRGLIGLTNESGDAVSSLQLAGRDGVGSSIDVVDLIKERVQFTYKNLPLDDGCRIPMDERWKCLYDAHSSWKQNGLI